MSSTPADTPWWTNLVAVLVTAVVTWLLTMYSSRRVSMASEPVSISNIATDTITYMPHILLLFGVLADMFTYQGVWSIPSLVGVLSIFANWVMQYFWKGLAELFDSANEVAKRGMSSPKTSTPNSNTATPATPATNLLNAVTGTTSDNKQTGSGYVGFTNYDGCTIQGFGFLRTNYAPQTLVVTATVFCYYIFDIVRNRGWVNAAVSIAFFSLFYIAQTAVLSMSEGGCGGEGSTLAQSLRALFEGIVFGGSAYGVVQTYYPNRLPSAVISPFPTRSAKDLTTGADGRMYDADGYPYVVLPNGLAVPDFAKQEDRNKFAELAGKNLGTGTPAKPDNCPTA